jgi:hypothetical protein
MEQDTNSLESPEFNIIIDYDDFIAGRELAEIIEIADETLWEVLEELYYPVPYIRRDWRRETPPSLVCVSEIRKGSMELICVLGTAAVIYCHKRFSKGFRKSRFGPSIESLGKALGDRMGSVIEALSINLGLYSEDAQRNGSRIKSIRVQRETKRKE